MGNIFDGIALPDPLDNHHDHHATGVFGLLALNDWLSRRGSASSEAGGGALEPRILAYLVHWPHWPTGADEARQAFALPEDFPAHGLGPVSLEISDQERRKKGAALGRYASQQMVMSGMVAFLREAELFIRLGAEDVRVAVSQVSTALILAPSTVEHRDP
jgi:LmbE family N-acetylglucosaminyl deacetylase